MIEYECPDCKKSSDSESWNRATREEFGDDIHEIGEYGGDLFCCPKCKKVVDYTAIVE